MQKIESQYFTSVSTSGKIKIINSVDYYCPHCGRRVNFPLGWSISQNKSYSLSTAARCSGCREISKFIYIDFDYENKDVGNLYIHPDPKRRKSILNFDTDSDFNEGLKKAYESALNVYNVGEWTATSVLVRRLLEGITHDLLPDVKNKPLAKRLEELPSHVDLKKPMLTLADALRKGGNLGAHFNLDSTPDIKIATQMMDLIDYLIEYLYILPKRIEHLHTEIENLNSEEGNKTEIE